MGLSVRFTVKDVSFVLNAFISCVPSSILLQEHIFDDLPNCNRSNLTSHKELAMHRKRVKWA